MTRHGRWLLVGLLGLACGCKGDDRDTLARITQKTAARLQTLAGGADGRLAASLQAVRGAFNDAAPDGRAALRLRWDRYLAEGDVRVRPAGPGVVRLEGSVPDDEHRRRAVELARSTLGVERVIDRLTVSKAAGR